MNTPLPSYEDLPAVAGAPAGSSWGLWGDGDRFGCLNLLTPERVVGAAQLVRRGAVFALNADLGVPGPPLFGRKPFTHTVTGPVDGPGHDDVLDGWNTQGSSQWDGFRHIRHPEHGFYAGLPDGGGEAGHGMHHWGSRGLAGRGVLVDVERWRASVGRPLDMVSSDPIEADDIVAALAAQSTTVEAGDVLLIRTGWLGWYQGLDEEARLALSNGHENPGLRPGREMVALLWDLHVAAVAADNPALETWPPRGVFMHHDLLPLLGIPIGELFALDDLAADCLADTTYAFLFTSAPLNLRYGVASPPNALAIK